MSSHTIIPATIISGFLGSGKTTLLNRIMQAEMGLRFAVMVNDFGQLNIDKHLIANNDGRVLSLANGCICCTISDDMVGQLEALLRREKLPDYILIEASGVSDPGRIARILNYPVFRERIALDAVVTLLDAGQLPHLETEFRQLAMTQLEAADFVIINKTDQCNATQLETIRRDWLFPDSRSFETVRADVPLPLILGTGAHTPLNTEFNDSEQHRELFDSLCWTWERPLKLDVLRKLLDELPLGIYRAKGIFMTQEFPETPLVFQHVGSRGQWKRCEDTAPCQESTLVLIGRRGGFDRDTLLQRFHALAPGAAQGHSHQHTSPVS